MFHLQTRYTFKYRGTDSILVVKVTDDVVCLKHNVRQQGDMKNVEQLSNFFFTMMSSTRLDVAVLGE